MDLSILRFAKFQQSEKLQISFITPVLVRLAALSEVVQESATRSLQTGQFRDCQLALALVMKERVLAVSDVSSALMRFILH